MTDIPADPLRPRLRDSLLYGVQQQPDTQAQLRQFSRQYGVPLPAAMGDSAYALPQHKVDALDADGLLRRTPSTAYWLATPDNAAIAHDDTPVLQQIEQTFHELGKLNLGDALKAAGYSAARGFAGVMRGIAESGFEPNYDGGLVPAITPEERAGHIKAIDAAARQYGGRMQELAPKTNNVAVQGIYGGAMSLAQNAPTMAASLLLGQPELALAAMGATTGGNAYQDAREKGKSPGAAAAYGAVQGVIEVATEKLPLKYLIGDVAAKSGFLKTLGHQLVSDGLGEQAATILQDLNEQITLHPEKTLGDYLRERPNAALQTAIATLVSGGALAGVTTGAQKIADAHQAWQVRAQASVAQTETVGNLMKAAQASALRQRDPQTFKDYVDAVAADMPVEHVYVHADDLMQALDAKPETLEENVGVLQAMPSVQAQLKDALPGNGLIEIPVSELLAFTPETALAQTLIENLKVDPNGFSMKEAEAFMQTEGDALQRDMAAAVEKGLNEDEFTASRDRLAQSITAELNKINRFTPDTNAAYAKNLAAFHSTMAARLGVSPEEFAQANKVTWQAAGVTPGSFMEENEAIPDDTFPMTEYRLTGVRQTIDGIDYVEAQPRVRGDAEWNTGQLMPITGPNANKALARAAADRAADTTLEQGAKPKLTPAVKHNGKLYKAQEGRDKTHLDVWMNAVPKEQRLGLVEGTMGFIDHRGRFLSRRRAMDYAREFGLVDPRYDIWAATAPELPAEWLAADALFQTGAHHAYEPGLGFQSSLFNAVLNAKQAKASADQWLAALRNTPGVKKEELEWIGLAEGLQGMGAEGAVTREQVLTYIAQNGVRVEEIQLGGEPNEDWIDERTAELRDEWVEDHTDGGDHFADVAEADSFHDGEGEDEPTRYQVFGPNAEGETFDTLEEAEAQAQDLNDAQMDEARDNLADQAPTYQLADQAHREWTERNGAQYASYQAIKGGENYRELLLTLPTKPEAEDGNPTVNTRLTRDFTAGMGHWDHNNVVAHTRLADFTTVDGKRALGVLEIQSDWHQKGRDKGYAKVATPEEIAATEQAFKDAITVRNDRAKALDIFLGETLPLQLEELKAQRDAALAADDATRAKRLAARQAYSEAEATWNRLSAAVANGEPGASAAEENAALVRKQELMREWENVSRNNPTELALRDAEFAVKTLVDGMAALEASRKQPYPEFIASMGNLVRARQIWTGIEGLMARDDATDQLNYLHDATLKANEASQAAKLARGEGGIPDAPFKTTWPALVMKRLIRMAVEQGYDTVIWATGEQTADLYDMREVLDGEVHIRLAQIGDHYAPGVNSMVQAYLAKKEGSVYEVGVPHNIAEVITRNQHGYAIDNYHRGRMSVLMTETAIREVFGGALGGNMLAAAGNTSLANNDFASVSGDDFAIGGEGHKAFYNRNLVNITNDIIKKFGAKVGVHKIHVEGTPRVAPLTPVEEFALEQARQPGVPAPRTPRDIRAEAEQIARDDPTVARHVQADGTYADPRLEALRNELRMPQALIRHAEVEAASGQPQWGFDITDKMREEEAAVKPALFQADSPTEARGSFTPSTNTITILRNADLSTALHELGHFYLETLARIAADDHAPQELKDDWAKAAQYIGFGGVDPGAWLAIPVDGRREGHEKWARGFENYAREGKAPSAYLRDVFRRFRAWLVSIYKQAKDLNAPLNDEIRGVFDRLLASQEEIAQVEQERAMAPLLATKPEGMSDAEWESYQRLGADATATAEEELASRSIRDMKWLANTRARIIRELGKQAAEVRKAVRAEVTAEVKALPVYRAMDFLKRGTIDGEPADMPHKLSIQEVEALYADNPGAPWQRLGYGKYGMLANAEGENAIHPDQAAELFGFTSGDHLVRELLAAAPVNEVIDGMTDQRVMERYGDLKDPDSIARAADEAIHNDVRLRFVATEANALAKAVGKQKVLAEAARTFARDLIGRQTIRNLKPAKYTGAATKAAVAAARAAARGDLAEAATQKRNQLINGHAAKAAFEAEKDVEKALRYLKRVSESEGARKAIDPDYRDQIDALLERFDLRTGQSLKAIDKRKSLAAWIKAMEDRGTPPVLDDNLVNEAYRKHYKDLTVDELRGLSDAVKNIVHLGRLKNKLLVAARGRAFDQVVDESEKLIREQAYRTLPERVETNTVSYRLLSGMANFMVIHRKFASLVREMSGFKGFEGGILWRAFIEPMNRANDQEAMMRAAATQDLARVFKRLVVKKAELRRKLYIPEIGRSLSLEGRLAVALNWGNELNRARIKDGDRWNDDQVAAILRTLTPDQLGFVNNMWEYLDSFWPQIAAKERRVTGVEPEKVEAEPFDLVAADGSVVAMRGGYYPIKYDTERSARSEADEIAEGVRAALRGAYTRATTRRGHTKARTEKVERPVRKDLMVPFGHVNQVIHDLAFHEYLIDANRLLSALEGPIVEHYGREVWRTMSRTLDDIAEGDIPAENSLERAVNHVRVGTTISGLGWNLLSGLMQPTGFTQSFARIGAKHMAKGIGRAFTDAATLQNSMKEIGEKSPFMKLRAQTMMREINEVQNQVRDSLKPAPLTAMEASYFALIQKFQMVVDVPTWLGAYAKAQEAGQDEETAIHLADQAVRDSQGSGQIGDLAQIQRGSVWFKLWTNFYSFFNVAYNQMAESVAETRRVGASRLPLLAVDTLLLMVAPAVLGELIRSAVKGGDDWDWETWGPKLAKAQISYALGFMVGLREIGGIVQNDGKAVSGPASLKLLTTDLPRLYQQVGQGELDDQLRKSLINAAGILFHFPAGQLNRTIDGIEAWANGEAGPQAAVFGPPPQK